MISRNSLSYIFSSIFSLILLAITFSQPLVNAAEPEAIGTIEDQTAYNAEPFDFEFSMKGAFCDDDGDSLNFDVKQSDDSDLPDWLTLSSQNINVGEVGSGIVGSYVSPPLMHFYRVAVSGNYAYVACDDDGLRVFDVSNPATSRLADLYDIFDGVQDVAVSGNYAYVAKANNGLQIFDISDPENLSVVGSCSTTYAQRVAVSGNYAYVLTLSSGLRIVDVSNPASPNIVGSYATSGGEVTVVGNYAYVAADSSGLLVIDVSNPASPSLTGTYNTPGSAQGVAVSGSYAYVLDSSSGLQVIDISNPASPSLTGSYAGGGYGITVSGNYAYVAAGSIGLRVIDISNPASPSLTGTYNTPGSAREVAVSGNYAYVADYTSGLGIIDVSNPASPSYAGSYDISLGAVKGGMAVSGTSVYVVKGGMWKGGIWRISVSNPVAPSGSLLCSTPGTASGVAVSGSYRYVADGDSGLQIFLDYSFVGSCDTPGYANGVVVSGNYAYVADGSSGLQIADISNPASPSIVGVCDTSGNALEVAISGNYAYVADGLSGLQIIDISNPASPSLVGTYGTSGYAWRVTVSGNYAYMADGDSGLQIIDISNPASPSLVGAYDTPGSARGVAVSGNYAYVADGGLWVIDISNPASPSLADSYDTPGNAYGVAVSGDYAYVADYNSGLQIIDVVQETTCLNLVSSYGTSYALGAADACGNYIYVADSDSGLRIIDISDPASPSLVGTYNTSGSAKEVVVSGNYAYVADGSSGLQIIDISNPVSPSLTGARSTSDALGIEVSGNYAYVADGASGLLQIIDISNPASPSLAGTYNTSGIAYGVAVSGNYAYVADGGSGLQIIDISNPVSPSLTGTYNTAGNAYGVAVLGNYAYVADDTYGLRIIDISNPASPSSVGSYNTPGSARGIAVSGNYAYVADYNYGLQIIDISNPASPSWVGSHNALGNAVGVAVSGDYIYLAEEDSGIQIFSFTPNNRRLSGTPGWHDMGPLNLKAIASDGNSTATAPFTINVLDNPTNNKPTIDSIYYFSDQKNVDIPLSEEDFVDAFQDSDGNITKVMVTTLPNYGTLKLSGTDVVSDQEINIYNTSSLNFSPQTDWWGATNFTWKGYDGITYSDSNLVDLVIDTLPVITTISVLGEKNTGLPFAQSMFTGVYSDGDGDPLTKIQITSLPSNGELRLSGIPVLLNQEISIAATDNLSFVPQTDWWGSTSFIWQAFDGAAYSNSGSVIIAIDTKPTIGTAAYLGEKNTDLYLDDNGFINAFTDADGDSLTKIQVKSLPNFGWLRFFGADVVVDQEVGIANATNLSFSPQTNWKGLTSFDWNGFDGLSYSDTDGSVELTIDTKPVISTVSGYGVQNIALPFDRNMFSDVFSDADVGDVLTKIKIASLPNNGQLRLSSVPVVLDQEIAIADTDNLVFHPQTDWVGNTNFGWQGYDGLAYSDSDTVNITITTKPEVSAVTFFGDENMTLVIDSSSFLGAYSDADGNNMTKIKVTSLPSFGDLKLLGVDVVLDQEIDVADIDDMRFLPQTDWRGATSFNWQAFDGITYSDNGIVNLFIDVQPVITTISNYGEKDSTLQFDRDIFINAFSDGDGDSLTRIKVTSLPSYGQLRLSGAAVTLDQEIDIAATDNVDFVPQVDWAGTTTFNWQAFDGIAYSDVGVVNMIITTKPVVNTVSLFSVINTVFQFDTSMFTNAFSDADGDPLARIRIMSLPGGGQLQLSSVAVSLNQEIDVGDIDDLSFVPQTDWTGTATFSWQGFDGITYSSNTGVVEIVVGNPPIVAMLSLQEK